MAVPQTTLNGAISTVGATSATVRDVLGFATSAEADDLVQIESEFLLVTGGLGTTSWTVSRGYAGSTAATHIDGSTVTRLERGYTDASRINKMANAQSVDYSYLQDCADASNGWLVGEVGRFYGPSTDTVRTFDVLSSSSTLFIPGGLRTFTKCEIKLQSTDTSWIDVTVDTLARPLSWDLLDGMVQDRVVFTDRPTLGYRQFYPGIGMARVTGAFGPLTPPRNLRRIADTVGWWLYLSRGAGPSGTIGDASLVANKVLSGVDLETIALYRGVGPSIYAMPAF